MRMTVSIPSIDGIFQLILNSIFCLLGFVFHRLKLGVQAIDTGHQRFHCQNLNAGITLRYDQVTEVALQCSHNNLLAYNIVMVCYNAILATEYSDFIVLVFFFCNHSIGGHVKFCVLYSAFSGRSHHLGQHINS